MSCMSTGQPRQQSDGLSGNCVQTETSELRVKKACYLRPGARHVIIARSSVPVTVGDSLQGRVTHETVSGIRNARQRIQAGGGFARHIRP